MGNCYSGELSFCCTRDYRNRDAPVVLGPLDEGLGHSFCYYRPDTCRVSSSKVYSDDTTTFRSISGASVSANTSTPLSTAFVDLHSYTNLDRAAAFECSTSFVSVPLQPVPRYSVSSWRFPESSGGFLGSGPIERGFLSGPVERGFVSGPLDHQFKRSLSHGDFGYKTRSKKGSLVGELKRAIAKRINRGQNSVVAPIRAVVTVKEPDWISLDKNGCGGDNNLTVNSNFFGSEGSLEYEESLESQNLQWAQGKAGEDRVQVVVSEEHGWVFVGIYDGFNGPDAPDFLVSNLYTAVQEQLKGLLWDDDEFDSAKPIKAPNSTYSDSNPEKVVVSIQTDQELNHSRTRNWRVEQENYPSGIVDLNSNSVSKKGRSKNLKNRFRGAGKKWEENQRRWKCEFDKERMELDKKLKEQSRRNGAEAAASVNHSDVMKALSQALKNTEEAFLDITDMMSMENPELALMGSCVLVMLMKGEDAYLINVGDSRAVLAQKPELDLLLGKVSQDLERINEESAEESKEFPSLTAIQLTQDHSTSVEEEVQRIKNEHKDDDSAVTNDRVKGSLKVTRAFGAGFLKKPKLNNALLEMFRINYIGKSPYITCYPSLYHHKLGPKDRFLILSSDGLYQYFTNEEAVSEVEQFISSSPEGDPAQHLVEQALFRAAKKAGMEFHDLLEIPQGDRRRYHDDISIMVISFEGRIWRSFA